MNKSIGLDAEAQKQIICGRTEVAVKRRRVDEKSGRETITTIHEGIVIQNFSDQFFRVYNPLTPAQGGDTAPEHAELFPSNSKFVWCEVINQLPERRAFRVPPTLR